VVVFNASTSPMKEGYAVSDSNVIKLAQPGVFTDSLTEVLRSGARALLTQAVEAEVAEFLAKHADLKTEKGHQRVVRHGHLPEREPASALSPFASRGCATVHLAMASASDTRQRSCRDMRGDRRALRC
jgi:hypothetical protein